MPPRAASPPATETLGEPIEAKILASAAAVASALAASKALQSTPPVAPPAGDDIDALNARVRGIMAAIADGSLGANNPMSDNREAILAVQRGAVVYHRRSQPMLVGAVAVVLAAFAMAPSVAYALASLAVMWVVVDFYGAVLHVVLDTPAFVEYPIIGAGCLEFQ